MWVLAVSVILIAFFSLMSSLFALAATRVPVTRTPREFLAGIKEAAGIRAGSIVVDAGCGDARTLSALCEGEEITGRGYELNGPVWLVGWMRVRFRRGGLRRIRICWRDFFRCELEDVDIVYCYLMPGTMTRVAKKCSEEMQPGTRLVSYLWPVPGWEPQRTVLLGPRDDPLYVYEIPASEPAEDLAGQKLDASPA